jgi:ribokinase
MKSRRRSPLNRCAPDSQPSASRRTNESANLARPPEQGQAQPDLRRGQGRKRLRLCYSCAFAHFDRQHRASLMAAAPRIAVVGSFAVGLTMKVDRFPARGETLLGAGYRMDHGGKGSNQAVGCARLGARVSFVARIGSDTFGEMALELYQNEGVDTTCVCQTSGAPTGVGFILVNAVSGDNCIALDPGANELLTTDAVRESSGALASARVVLTQLEIPAPAADAALAEGRTRGAITILNPAPARPLPPETLRGADILTPNETEAKVLLGHPADAGISPEDLACELIARGSNEVVLTLGGEGALIVTREGQTRVSAISVPVVDTTGAGDAFNAGLAVALASGADLESAVRFAVVTGGLAVTKEGVIPALPRGEQVLACLARNGLPVPRWFDGSEA